MVFEASRPRELISPFAERPMRAGCTMVGSYNCLLTTHLPQILQHPWIDDNQLSVDLLYMLACTTIASEACVSLASNLGIFSFLLSIFTQFSEKFEGNDGHWSTFVVDAGTSGQQFHVLPSLSSAGLWLPIPDGCNRTDAPDDCPELRGAQSFGNRRNEGYNTSLSNSYTVIGIFKLVFPSIETETHYGEPWSNSSGLYATDTVSLHSGYNSSIQLDDSLVVSIKTVNYFMGLFGLAHGGVKLFSHTYQSLLSTLNSSSAESPRIPSMSYGYTAGAYYRNNTFGSLVLGGYDRSRRLDSDAPDSEISMPLDANDSEALKVLVSDMTVRTGGGNAQSVMGGVYQNFEVNIDSTLPYLWLPPAVCDKLSDALGLKFDNETGLYTLSNQQRQNNLDGITIGIRLTRADEQDQALQVDLPYAAFDQDVSWPFYNEAKHYFPIKRAEGSMAYTFGRTFLQEAYVTVDYDQKNWSLSRVNWTESRPEPQVVPIINPSFETSSGGRGLSTGAIVGIVFGVLAVLLLAAGWFFFKRRRQNRKKLLDDRTEVSTVVSSELPAYMASMHSHSQMNSRHQVHEMESPPLGGPLTSYYGHHKRLASDQSGRSELESPDPGSPPLSMGHRSIDYFSIGTPGAREPIHEMPGESSPNAARNRNPDGLIVPKRAEMPTEKSPTAPDLPVSLISGIPTENAPAAGDLGLGLEQRPAERAPTPLIESGPDPPVERAPSPSTDGAPSPPTERLIGPPAEYLVSPPTERFPSPPSERFPSPHMVEDDGIVSPEQPHHSGSLLSPFSGGVPLTQTGSNHSIPRKPLHDRNPSDDSTK